MVLGLSLVLWRQEAVVPSAYFLLSTLQRPEGKDHSGNSGEATPLLNYSAPTIGHRVHARPNQPAVQQRQELRPL